MTFQSHREEDRPQRIRREPIDEDGPSASTVGRPGRVLLVAPQPFYQDRGTPIAVSHVLRGLSELGYRVDVLTFAGGRDVEIPGVRFFRVADPLRLRNVPVGFSFRKLWLDTLLSFAIRKRLRETPYSCIHAVEEAAFLAVWAARRDAVPVIYDMQSSMAEQMAQLFLCRARFVRAALYACEQWLIRHADRTVCSAGLADRVRSVLPEARIQEWRYPAQIPSPTSGELGELRNELDLAPEGGLVLYTGTFEDYQGLATLVDALPRIHAEVPTATFVLVGAEESNRSALERRLAAVLPPGAFRLLPRQPRDRMPGLLALADVVVSPRNFGGNLPIKILEYLAAGRAIVATAIPAHRAVLNDETAVLVQPSPAHMATAIIGLLRDPARVARLQHAARSYAETHLGWTEFRESLRELLGGLLAASEPGPTRVSVVIPAKNAAGVIGDLVALVQGQRREAVEIETVVVDSGSMDGTAAIAERAGARVVTLGEPDGPNPAAARNRGAMVATGDPIVFLDDDCTPADGWLDALLAAHAAGATCVGGSLALPPGLPASARWDYYCGWYHVHPARRPGRVRHHPPCNLSVRRDAFRRTRGFVERQPIAYAHEELAWQAELQRAGHAIVFEPRAVAYHWNRPGIGNLLRRNYRWAYSAIESKAETGVARMSWLYRYPRALIAAGVFLAPPQAVYITWCWIRHGVLEPLLAFPVILAARLAYALGMCAGGVRWLRRRGTAGASVRPRWE